MELIDRFIQRAAARPARIVYPEGTDERIPAAAERVKKLGIAEPLILGDPDAVTAAAAATAVDLTGITVISPDTAADLERYAETYARERDLRVSIARRLVRKPLPYAGMMVHVGDADGMVAGVASATASVLQAASLTIGFGQGLSTPSSFFIMAIPGTETRPEAPLIFADCAVNIAPSPQQLAEIAVASGTNAQTLLGIEPRVAFLSFSTRGSANHRDVTKVTEALRIAREMRPDLKMDGELQGDAALSPRVAAKKVNASEVAGRANVLIFPDLDAANIAYKLVQQLGGATAIGPVMQGFAKPVNDLSRGASVEDIVAVTAITVVQAAAQG